MKKAATAAMAILFACSPADSAQKSAAQLRREADRARFSENAKARRDIAPAEKSGADEESVIIRVDGSDSGATRPFAVSGPWEIQWVASGNFFAIVLMDSAGKWVDLVANQGSPGKGSSYRPTGGTYYLDIQALGAWKIRAVRVASPE